VAFTGIAIRASTAGKRHINLSAENAGRLLRATAIETENTALTPVTLQHASAKVVAAMNKEYFNSVCGYKSAVAQARLMLLKGIITESEYAIIDTMMAEKYGISSCSLFRENGLIYRAVDGNMSHYEEVR
jgi:hypothetical protein